MWLIFVAVVLGIVEGLTEFIPVSSTGHMIIVGDLLGFTGKRAECFEVVIQLGAILAVVIIYWERFLGLFIYKTAEGDYNNVFYNLARDIKLFSITNPYDYLVNSVNDSSKKRYLVIFQNFKAQVMLFISAILSLFIGIRFYEFTKKYFMNPLFPTIFLTIIVFLIVVILFTFTIFVYEKNSKLGFQGLKAIIFLIITSIPAMILGKLIHGYMKEHLFHPIPVTIALAVGAIFILFAEKFRPKSDTDSLDGISWKQALMVGLFQCLSLWPGMSRSASTIIGGMFAKLDRKVAAEYSFLAAVPIMFVASAYDLYKTRNDLCRDDIPLFTVGFIVAMIVAGIAVKTFIKLLQHWTLVPFAIYRLIFAGVFGALVWTGIVQLTAK